MPRKETSFQINQFQSLLDNEDEGLYSFNNDVLRKSTFIHELCGLSSNRKIYAE